MKRWVVLMVLGLAGNAWGAEDALMKFEPAHDLPTIERGADTVTSVCMGCHSLKYVHFRDLMQLGLDKDKVDGLRGSNPMGAPLMSSMPEDAAKGSFGKVPPDLSLMARAREGEAAYVYSYLLGYYNKPDGSLGNHYYPPTKMPDVLGVAGVTDPAQRADIEKKAREAVSFLVWAEDPHAEERHVLGYYVLGYLAVFTTLVYLLKRRVWSRLDKQ